MKTAVNPPDTARFRCPAEHSSFQRFSFQHFSISALPKSPFSPATPFFPASGPATRSFNGLHPKSNFLAISGTFRTFYSAAQSAYSATDWITISANPALDETGRDTQRVSQRAWSIANKHTWLNGHEIFKDFYTQRDRGFSNYTTITGVATTNGSTSISFSTTTAPSGNIVGTGIPVVATIISATTTTAVLSAAATANGSGLTMNCYDAVHLNSAGTNARNAHIWKTLPLGNFPLGADLADTQNSPAAQSNTSTNIDAAPVDFRRSISVYGPKIGIRRADTPWDGGEEWGFSATGGRMNVGNANVGPVLVFDFSSNRGIHPYNDGDPWGLVGQRPRMWMTGMQSEILTKTAAYTATANDHTLLGNATSAAFAITLPIATSHAGRIYCVKKIDSSGNAVTIAGNP